MLFFKKSILILLSFILSIYISELTCSYFKFYADTFPVKIKSDENLPYLMESNQHLKSVYKKTIFINKDGFRDNLSKKDTKNTFRIMVLGDSSTFGWGLNFEETYPHLLKLKLIKKNKNKIEIFNLGHPGFNFTDYYNLYLKAQKKIKPNLIVIGVNTNDYYTDKMNLYIEDGVAREYNSIWYKLKIPSSVLIKLRESSLYLTIRTAFKNIKTTFKKDIALNYKVDRKIIKNRNERMFSLLNKFKTIAKDNSIKIHIIYWPINIEIKNNSYEFKELRDILIEASKDENLFFHDMFNDFVNSKQLIYNNKYDLVHPSKYGHNLIAKRLAKKIQFN